MNRRMLIGRATTAVVAVLAIAWGMWGNQKNVPDPRGTAYRIAFQARNGLVYIPAEVNGHRVFVLLDTGADATAFCRRIVHPISPDVMIKLNLASGSVFGFRVPVDFTLGRSDLKEKRCLFHRDVVVGDFTFDGADGAIGLDVLSSFKSVTLDFKNSVLVLEDYRP
jgi:hypothetical protein